jgi:hypothetical protein
MIQKSSRVNKTAIELFLAGVRDWGAECLLILTPEPVDDH